MKRPRWVSWTLLVLAAVLILAGVFVLGFLTEPSAVGRMRSALYVIGAGSIVLGVAAAAGGVWMLATRRT
jgi:hypothetical protein